MTHRDYLDDYPTDESPVDYRPEVETSEIAQGRQDDLDELGSPGDAPNTSLEAIRLGRRWIEEDRWVGVGFCLRTIRSLFGLGAVYPDAQTAWEEAERKHPTSDPDEIPWGVPVFWTGTGSGHGHIALSIGKGRCLTTDYRETGELGIAPISVLADWCGGDLAGWTNDLNGVDVWEPRPERPPRWDLDDRIRLVEAALERARSRDANPRRIEGLRRWLRDLRARR